MNHQQKKIIINYIEQIIYKTKMILISFIRKLSKFVIWIVWDFSGVRFVWQKIRPPVDKSTDKRLPATFLLWIVSIYLILFGITSQRYENRVDIIENRANAILTQLTAPVDTPQFKNAINRIPIVQNMSCPVKPNIFKPNSIFNSLFENGKHEETVVLLRETLVDFKDNLNDVNLSKVNLEGVNFKEANFQNSDLRDANFQDSELNRANFQNALLRNANFQNASLINTNFQNTGLYFVNFQNASLLGADFQNANLHKTNFQNVNLYDVDLQNAWCTYTNFKDTSITVEQLLEVETLYNAQLDTELIKQNKKDYPLKQMKKDYPHLFKEHAIANNCGGGPAGGGVGGTMCEP